MSTRETERLIAWYLIAAAILAVGASVARWMLSYPT
jgi:hypothetical protein